MSLNRQYDIGNYITTRIALGNFQTTQGSGGAALAEADGITIDRNDTSLRRYYSCQAVVSAAFTAGSSQRTASISLNVQHSSDGTSWEDYSTGTEPDAVELGTTDTGGSTGTTGGTDYGKISQNVNLVSARRYVRLQLPAPTFDDCSSASILTGHGLLVFGGGDELPAT